MRDTRCGRCSLAWRSPVPDLQHPSRPQFFSSHSLRGMKVTCTIAPESLRAGRISVGGVQVVPPPSPDPPPRRAVWFYASRTS